MPIREPRNMGVYMDGELYRIFRSVRNGIKFLAEYLGVSYATAKKKIDMACRESDGYFLNFRFVKDPNYVTSRPVVATNLITGDYIIFPSVGKAGVHIFGKHVSTAPAKITALCQNGGIHGATGMTFRYIENGCFFTKLSCW